MIDPGSMGDWLEAFFMAGLIGAAGALFVRALRSEEPMLTVEEPAVVASKK